MSEHTEGQFWASSHFHELPKGTKPLMKTPPNASHRHAAKPKARDCSNYLLPPPRVCSCCWLLSCRPGSPRPGGPAHAAGQRSPHAVPPPCTAHDIGFTSRTEAAARLPPARTLLRRRLSPLSVRRSGKKKHARGAHRPLLGGPPEPNIPEKKVYSTACRQAGVLFETNTDPSNLTFRHWS